MIFVLFRVTDDRDRYRDRRNWGQVPDRRGWRPQPPSWRGYDNRDRWQNRSGGGGSNWVQNNRSRFDDRRDHGDRRYGSGSGSGSDRNRRDDRRGGTSRGDRDFRGN